MLVFLAIIASSEHWIFVNLAMKPKAILQQGISDHTIKMIQVVIKYLECQIFIYDQRALLTVEDCSY